MVASTTTILHNRWITDLQYQVDDTLKIYGVGNRRSVAYRLLCATGRQPLSTPTLEPLSIVLQTGGASGIPVLFNLLITIHSQSYTTKAVIDSLYLCVVIASDARWRSRLLSIRVCICCNIVLLWFFVNIKLLINIVSTCVNFYNIFV